MKRKFITIFLIILTIGLLATTTYIGLLLKNSNQKTAITTIKKTKASSMTYTAVYDIGNPILPTLTLTPSPTETLLAKASVSLTVAPSPTEILLAKASVSPTSGQSATISPTKAKLVQLPETAGHALILPGIIISASVVVILSLIF